MSFRHTDAAGGAEAGFSMVEMLMAAMVLAVGILGVTMIQVMALKASMGSRSVTSAAQVGERVLDQVEEEGRLTWLNLTDTAETNPTALTTLSYINLTAPVTQYYDNTGQYLGTSANPGNFYTVQLSKADIQTQGSAVGGMSDFTVVVSFVDTVGANSKRVTRNVTLTRRIVHG